MEPGDELRVGGKRYRIACHLNGANDRYEVIEESFGLGGRRCALHVVPNSREIKRRIRLLHRASNESKELPTILDVHYRGQSIFVVLAWVDGSSLEKALYDPEKKRRRKFSCREATRVIRGLAHQVSKLHKHARIVHGDIKPDNLIVPKALELRLIDFGSSWAVEETTQLGEGFTEGASPGYAAPEQARVLAGDDSLGHPDFRSDQFAVSVIYYELLTGKLPYDGLGGQAGVTDERMKLYGPRLKRPSKYRLDRRLVPPGTWDAMDEVVCRGVALSPAERYQRTGEWLDDLRRTFSCFESARPLTKNETAFGKLLLWGGDAWEVVKQRIGK